MIKEVLKKMSLIAIVCIFAGCTSGVISTHKFLDQDIYLTQDINVGERAGGFITKVIAFFDRNVHYPELTIQNPYNESIFPMDIASPTFSWRDNSPDSGGWLIAISFKGNGHSIYVATGGMSGCLTKRHGKLSKPIL